ncbi:dihydrofolate reductase family protein [Lentzea californiensis]|uniref:dihydrofolate reductase family protein n=1 Tax=Lentzea californiensis TaxID=438851 RepID=UPI0021657E7B|nr:dihydrofolate reductase family protein [Lentzea californiensis]MCR3750632.1 Dihydrofolate reductase [Lentzea californiensis]
MRSVSTTMFMTLDGVVQGFGRPDEDTRGGFTQGGWGARYQDDVLAAEMAKGMAGSGSMLFGRRTWQDFIGVWASATDGNPFTTHMNAARKYVVSSSLPDADAWENSVLLRSIEDVAALDDDLSVIGSAALVRSLHAAGLVDRYTLVIHPVALGGGARLFDGPTPLTEFELTGSVTTPKGVIVAHYDRIGPGRSTS